MSVVESQVHFNFFVITVSVCVLHIKVLTRPGCVIWRTKQRLPRRVSGQKEVVPTPFGI